MNSGKNSVIAGCRLILPAVLLLPLAIFGSPRVVIPSFALPALIQPIQLSALNTAADFNRAYERMLKRHGREIRSIQFNLSDKRLREMSMNEFLNYTRNVLRRWDAAKYRLKATYLALSRREKISMEAEFQKAMRQDRARGSNQNVARFLKTEQNSTIKRTRQFRRMQILIDENGRRLNKDFKRLFHTRLDLHIKGLKKQNPDRRALEQAKGRLFVAIKKNFSSRRGIIGRRRSYMLYWSDWFFKKSFPPERAIVKKEPVKKEPARVVEKKEPLKKEPARVVEKKEPLKKEPARVVEKKEPLKKEPARVVEKKEPLKKEPARVVEKKEPLKKEPARVVEKKEPLKKEPARVVEKKEPIKKEPVRVVPVLPCEDNSCNLEQYTIFFTNLKRSCFSTDIPDMLIKSCFKDYIILDLRSPRKQEVFNFMRFTSGHTYDRIAALRYFEDRCYAFRPVIELSEKLVSDKHSPLNLDHKQRLAQGIDYLKKCH